MPMLRKSNQLSVRLFLSLAAASSGLLYSNVPAIAQASLAESIQELSKSQEEITWGQSGSIPTDVWNVVQAQTNSKLGSYGDVFQGGSLPQEVWDIAQTQLELPDGFEQVFSGTGGASGSIPPEVWQIMQSQSGIPEQYGGIFDSVEQIVSKQSGAYDFDSIVNRDSWGINAFSDQTFAPGNIGGNIAETGLSIFSGMGKAAQNASDTFAQLNPFKRSFEWIKKTPGARVIGTLGKRIRGALTGSNFGFFTRNRIVKERDQANLFDQEIARMMAEQYLGESGEQWLAGEAQDTLNVLQTGLQSANAAMQIAADSKGLTSTQDVAKAVAQQGGQNAVLSAAVLQMQAQNQASLLQLQQLTSSSIQLAANNSEGIDETNRRERAERSNALTQSASEFIYVPDVFD